METDAYGWSSDGELTKYVTILSVKQFGQVVPDEPQLHEAAVSGTGDLTVEQVAVEEQRSFGGGPPVRGGLRRRGEPRPELRRALERPTTSRRNRVECRRDRESEPLSSNGGRAREPL
jgi:hypothetical protein